MNEVLRLILKITRVNIRRRGALNEMLGVTFWPYNKSFIGQACSVKMAGYWARSFFFFFCVFMDLDFVSIHKNAKKELGQYPAILTSRLVNNAYLCGFCAYQRKHFEYFLHLHSDRGYCVFVVHHGYILSL